MGGFNARTNTVKYVVTNEVPGNNNPEYDILPDDDIDVKNVLETLG